MFLKLALRHILANRRRSLVTIMLISGTTMLLVLSTAWMEGSHQAMLRNAVEIYPGYVQITGRHYRQEPSNDNLIFNSEATSAWLAQQTGIASFGCRFESYVLFAKGDRSVGGMLAAIEPDKERFLSRLADSLHQGAYLAADDTNKVYLGVELAKRLQLQVGDKLAFVGQGADFSFSADLLTVKGIFKTGLFDFDATSAFVARPYFNEIMAAHNLASHIVIRPLHPSQAQQLASQLEAELDQELHIECWQQSMAALVQAMELDSIFGYITLAIIFIVIFFVVMIYTLLAVVARIRQLGVLRAIGTTPSQIFRLLIFESSLLALTSVSLGGLAGGLLAWYFQVNPVTFSGFEEQFKQYGLAVSAMPTLFSFRLIGRDMFIMFCLTLLSTLYPILKVNRIRPTTAINPV